MKIQAIVGVISLAVMSLTSGNAVAGGGSVGNCIGGAEGGACSGSPTVKPAPIKHAPLKPIVIINLPKKLMR